MVAAKEMTDGEKIYEWLREQDILPVSLGVPADVEYFSWGCPEAWVNSNEPNPSKSYS